jgi:DNA-binding SARP family transcriptional activator/tetratricopeptide (TPR) repeat protein/DNA polymerase III delta prime subunit
MTGTVPPDIQFAVLGPLRAWRLGTELPLGTPQQRVLLAVLLVHAGQPVPVSVLVDALWDEEPPRTAVNVIHRYVGKLRRLLEPDLPVRADGRWLLRDGAAYRLRVDAGSADVLRFRELAAQARAAWGRAAGEEAMGLFLQALMLWKGPCASGTRPGAGAEAAFTALDQECLAIVVEAADVALAGGAATKIVRAVRAIASYEPLNEALHARLILLLASAGQRAEALAVFRALTGRLADELGIDPGPEVRAAYQQVLRQQTGVVTPRPRVRAMVATPAQLPGDLRAFSGRAADLRRMLDAARSPERPMRLALIDGMPGVGKTTMAIHLAHELAGQFPDGQLYANLRGYDPVGAVTDLADTLRHFLLALGMAGNQIPPSLDAQVGLYRSLLADKRVLVVLDNARDAGQVSPLVPGSSGCLTVVTSRNRLTGLVAKSGGHPFTLHPMPVQDARAMLVARLGDGRGEQEPQAVDEIVAMCAGLPLALAIAAARAATYPQVPLRTIARELASAQDGLDVFSRHGDTAIDLRAVFTGSYRTLSPDAGRMFRLLASHWGPDVSVAACRSMTGMTPSDTDAALLELTWTQLLTEHVPGRFQFHDLVRVYAMELSRELDSAQDRDAATRRMLDHYLSSGTYMSTAVPMRPIATPLPTQTPTDGVHPEMPSDETDTMGWFTAEQQVLTTIVTRAGSAGFTAHAWQLAMVMLNFFQSQGQFLAWVTTMHTGLDAARAAGDVPAEARAARGLAGGYYHSGDSANALRYLTLAQRLADGLGWTTEKAHILRNTGDVLAELGHTAIGDYARAYGCYERAAELHRELDEPRGLANCLVGLGTCLVKMGEPERGRDLHRQAIELFQSVGDVAGEAVAWAEAAEGCHEGGDHATAISHYSHAVDLCRKVNHYTGQVRCLRGLGDVLVVTGDRERARVLWEEALSLMTSDRTSANYLAAEEIKKRLADLG